MKDLFFYNWQIREEWFEWCESLPSEEVFKKRTGGMGSIAYNLYHIMDCEQIWINQLQGTPVILHDMKKLTSLHDIKSFSQLTQMTTRKFLETYESAANERVLSIKRKNGSVCDLPHGKVLKHIVSHEIHHIGQLSVWSREMELKPVSSDLIFRSLE